MINIDLLSLAIAPILIGLFYIYIRDKYEKEPVRLLLTGLVYGFVITVPIIQAENFVTLFIPNSGGVLMEAFYLSFLVASLVEELFKFAVLFFLVWRNDNFNERFDGIVYAVFISLGFAAVENVLYVTNPQMGGLNTALLRGVVSVPGHALFGVAMGYYFALSKFIRSKRVWLFIKAFFVPWFLHGVYDFILLSNMKLMMPVFIAFVAYMWFSGFKKMKRHIENSPFKINETKKKQKAL